jgi:hypothetical protein
MKQAPLARQASLIVKELPDETLVYDLETDKAHCLNETSARVWKSCDGRTSVSEITRRLGAKLESPVDEAVVWLALDQLEKFKLLEKAPAKPAHLSGITRRQVIARLGIAAVALPLIISIVSPTAQAAGSVLPIGSCCTNPNECVTGCCSANPVPPCNFVPGSPANTTKTCAPTGPSC